jgi:hypothetical protein
MPKARKPIDYEELNPGIRMVVWLLREAGFETISSGDGQTHACECDADFPFVTVRVKPKCLVKEARRLARLLAGFGLALGEWTAEGQPEGIVVDATYSTLLDGAFVQLAGLDDALLLALPGAQGWSRLSGLLTGRETPAAEAGVEEMSEAR